MRTGRGRWRRGTTARKHLVELGQCRDGGGLDASDRTRRRHLKPHCGGDRLLVVEQQRWRPTCRAEGAAAGLAVGRLDGIAHLT
jgi:hypothetical protein